MLNGVFILGVRKVKNEILTMSTHPVKHIKYEDALEEAKRIKIQDISVSEVLIFKMVTSVKQPEPVFEITELFDRDEEPLEGQLPEEEQQPVVSKDIEPLKPNNPYVPNKMVRSTGPMVQLYTLNPEDLFIYHKTTYRLLHTSYPYKSRVFNTEINQEEDISSCVYVLPVTEQAP